MGRVGYILLASDAITFNRILFFFISSRTGCSNETFSPSLTVSTLSSPVRVRLCSSKSIWSAKNQACWPAHTILTRTTPDKMIVPTGIRMNVKYLLWAILCCTGVSKSPILPYAHVPCAIKNSDWMKRFVLTSFAMKTSRQNRVQ